MAGNPQGQQALLQSRGESLPWGLGVGQTGSGSLATGIDLGIDDRRGLTREEWSEEATAAVIEVWGEKHLAINRGKLKKQEWDEVAEKVSARLGGDKYTKTWLQCKNKIDSIKKKYKIVLNQKASGTTKKEWRLFDRVHELIGGIKPDGNGGLVGEDTDDEEMDDCQNGLLRQAQQPILSLPQDIHGVPLSSQVNVPSEIIQGKSILKKRKEPPSPYKELAFAIKELGARYEKVEVMRQEKTFELERMRMAFTKELEMQRIQVQLEVARLTGCKQCQHERSATHLSYSDAPHAADDYATGVPGG